MQAWYENLSLIETIYFWSASVGGVLFAVRLVLLILGGDHGDMHGDVADGGDLGDADAGDAGDSGAGHDAGADLHLLTFQGITAFLMLFGLVGMAFARDFLMSAYISLPAGVGAGVAGAWICAKLVQMLMRLQSSGTIDLRDAIGKEGSVYLTIPAGGTGKVQVVVQERLMELAARSVDEAQAIPTGERVWVDRIVNGNVLVVATRQ